MDIVIATCRQPPEVDPDARILLNALAARGLGAAEIPWEDGPPDARRVIIRSTWNYVHHHQDFLAWADAVGDRLLNPPAIVRWNTHKQYLDELARAGIPVIPTRVHRRGSSAILEDAWGSGRLVVKPAVGAGSYLTRALTVGPAEQQWFQSVLAERDMLVQPYVTAVETTGERAIVWIDGEVSHAVRKRPRFEGEAESVEVVPVSPEEHGVATRCMAYAARYGELLYGRIDVVHDGERVRVMELELVEPSLFLLQSPAGLERFADAIAARC